MIIKFNQKHGENVQNDKGVWVPIRNKPIRVVTNGGWGGANACWDGCHWVKLQQHLLTDPCIFIYTKCAWISLFCCKINHKKSQQSIQVRGQKWSVGGWWDHGKLNINIANGHFWICIELCWTCIAKLSWIYIELNWIFELMIINCNDFVFCCYIYRVATDPTVIGTRHVATLRFEWS